MTCAQKRTDVGGTHISYGRALTLPWRRGTQVGRTVYAHDPKTGWGRLIMVCDTVRLADHVVLVHNQAVAAAAEASRNEPFQL